MGGGGTEAGSALNAPQPPALGDRSSLCAGGVPHYTKSSLPAFDVVNTSCGGNISPHSPLGSLSVPG